MSTMNAPTTEQLRDALWDAHDASARRGNASTQALQLAAGGSGDFTKAISAALATLGGNHGPLRQTQELLMFESPAAAAYSIMDRGGKVPGWGNSFVRGQHDPIWATVREMLAAGWPMLAERIEEVTAALHARDKNIYPNPSAYTAACAIAFDIPPVACASLFVAARLTAWTDLFLSAVGA